MIDALADELNLAADSGRLPGHVVFTVRSAPAAGTAYVEALPSVPAELVGVAWLHGNIRNLPPRPTLGLILATIRASHPDVKGVL